MMPGTRMSPCGSMRQANSDSRSSSARSMAHPSPWLHIDDTLGKPRAVRFLRHLEAGVRRPFDLDGRIVLRRVHRLSPRPALERAAVDAHAELTEQHAAGRHLVDERVQPIDEQKLMIGRFAT